MSMTSGGVSLGAPIPAQPLASYPGTNSPIAGTSGNFGERIAVVTANARSLPALTCSIELARGSKVTCTWPPNRLVSASGWPRYGTPTRSTPAIILNSSPEIWGALPAPLGAMLILPGLARAYVINSGIVFAGNNGFTTMTDGELR